jgi:hypothetical protein
MSDAPARDPSRRVSSLISSLRMMALQRLETLVAREKSRKGALTLILLAHRVLLGKVPRPSECWQKLRYGSCP